MDNSKSYLPRYLEHAKEYQGTERLPTKVTGGLIHSGCYQSKRKVMFFLNHEQVLTKIGCNKLIVMAVMESDVEIF